MILTLIFHHLPWWLAMPLLWPLAMFRGWRSTREAGDRFNWRALIAPPLYLRWLARHH